MKGVHIDPKSRIARVEPGATWGDFDHAAHAFGLATTGGVLSTTGVAGLTLGGGMGYLSRRYGLSCDNLLAADVVTADGKFLTATEDENADLLWGLRGGGGNFGAVTSLQFRMHPVDRMYGGPVFYPIERTGDVLRFYRSFIADAPEDVGAFFAIHIGPPAPFIPPELQGVTMAAIVACYTGPEDKAEAVLAPLQREIEPQLDLLHWAPYPALQGAFDAILPPGLNQYWKADYVKSISDDAIAVHERIGPTVPNWQSTMHIYATNGAEQRVAPDATAYSHRDKDFVHVIVGTSPNAADMPSRRQWVRNYWEALGPTSEPGAYVNFLDNDEGSDRVKASYGSNYPRLASLKAKYDPDNVFRFNQNIEPEG